MEPLSQVDAPGTSLSFSSYNNEKSTTLVLLHGGFTCRLEYALVLPHLSDFHILLPDLPLHSASRHIQPGTTENSAKHVAELIRSNAHGGKAHVVGVSMGGYIAQCLALSDPDLVLSLFVTGAAPPVGARLFMARWISVSYYTMKLMISWLPAWVYQNQASSQGLKISNELMVEMDNNITWELCQDMFPWIVSFSLDDVASLKVPTLSIAGAKGDDVPMIERVAEALGRGQTDHGRQLSGQISGAAVVRKATHGWDMQLPELFARGVSAWVKGEKLPHEFQRL